MFLEDAEVGDLGDDLEDFLAHGEGVEIADGLIEVGRVFVEDTGVFEEFLILDINVCDVFVIGCRFLRSNVLLFLNSKNL